MRVLPDINVLLALTYDRHGHHAVAKTWLDSTRSDDECIVCRVTQAGLLRLTNNPAVLHDYARSGQGAWDTWDLLLQDGRFQYHDEPEGFDACLRELTISFRHQPKKWQDAQLAAYAILLDATLVTFDSGFRSFGNLRCQILGP